ncbi:UvrD-helicase domain-containing protein, partial [Camelimonas fluminis]
MSQFQDDTEEVRVEEALVEFQALSATALTNLTKTQHSAVTAPFGPVLILAGAGTGKTRCLTSRIAWVIGERKLSLQHVLAITFTRKAAHEMKERLEHMMGPAARSMNIGTFHSICIRILRDNAEYIDLSPRFTVLDDDEQLAILKEVIAHDFPEDAKSISAAAIRDALERFSIIMVHIRMKRSSSHI